MRLPIYMDHHATTPLDPRVLEAMMPYLTERFGNAASRTHSFGWEAEEAVETARRQVADLLGAEPREIVFTSGATEAINLALKGAAEANADRGRHIVTVSTEHRAVLDTCRRLESRGFRVTYLPVDSEGLLDLEDVRAALSDDTILLSVMAANNEIGVLHPIEELGALARVRGVLFHCDAAQAAGKVPLDVRAAGIDLLSLSAHKLYGPKGIGALYVRRRPPRVRIEPQIDGGGHERGLRSGTLNVPGIVGFGAACEICSAEMEEEARRLRRLRDRLADRVLSELPKVRVNGHRTRRLPGNLNLSFPGVEGESLLMALNEVALSSGSACSSAMVEPSHVLLALGLTREMAKASVRFGVGRYNTEEEVDHVARRVVEAARQVRALSAAPAAPLQATERV